MNRETWEVLKRYSAPAFVILLFIALAYEFRELIEIDKSTVSGASLSLLVIGGVIVLILLLTVVAMIFSGLGLTNKDQAMGLPEGSIRAVIALSLIVLFAILSVFLYEGVSGGSVKIVQNLTDEERAQFLKDHPTARDIQSIPSTDPKGQPLKDLYNVTYRSAPDTTSDDFAKQLLVLLGTLMTAVTSFYLGAGTATSAAAGQPMQSSPPPPKIFGVNPTVHAVASNGPILHLQVLGTDLDTTKHVSIVRGNVEISGTNVAPTPAAVTCDIDAAVIAPAPGAPWDVVIDDGGSQSARLPNALTIS